MADLLKNPADDAKEFATFAVESLKEDDVQPAVVWALLAIEARLEWVARLLDRE